jgi:four helix bundle protein
MNKKDLENRLLEFSVNVIDYAVNQGKHPAVVHLKDQAIRSSTATALNYAEAQSAESKKDFIHKLGLVMKELRETQASLRLIKRFSVSQEASFIDDILRENDELLAIFHKTIMTAKKNT